MDTHLMEKRKRKEILSKETVLCQKECDSALKMDVDTQYHSSVIHN